PVTLARDPLADASALLQALESLGDDYGFIFTGSNADEGGRQLTSRLRSFVDRHPNATFHPSLGTDLYVNALAHCGAVVGNSSSGLYEAPSMHVPTVNIGRRQEGRLRATSVIDTPAEATAILNAISKSFSMYCRNVVNPYGDGGASQRMVCFLKQLDDPASLLNKTFYRGSLP
ncbi:MAG: UDP-N-acetylglucosamine 2-epimerase, partial [Aestuariivirga sp.]